MISTGPQLTTIMKTSNALMFISSIPVCVRIGCIKKPEPEQDRNPNTYDDSHRYDGGGDVDQGVFETGGHESVE